MPRDHDLDPQPAQALPPLGEAEVALWVGGLDPDRQEVVDRLTLPLERLPLTFDCGPSSQ